MQAQVLCFNIPAESRAALFAAADLAGAQAVEVMPCDFSQPVGALLGILPKKKEICLAPFREPMLVMCAFDREKLDAFLEQLKLRQLRFAYKAMLTPTNMAWGCDELLGELKQEHEQFRQMKEKK